MGEGPAEAARKGANQVNFAVIATTAVLIAVFLPVSFMKGEIGQIFAEFGIVLAVAVTVSGFVALTLSPVLAAELMPQEDRPGRLTRLVDRLMAVLERGCRAGLVRMMRLPQGLLATTGFAVAACFALWQSLPQEVTPEEDRGQFRICVTAPQGSSLACTDAATREVEAPLAPLREAGTASNITSITGTWGELRRAMIFVNLVPWDQRDESVRDFMAGLRGTLGQIAEVQTWMPPSSGLGIGGGRGGLQFMLGGPDIERASVWSEEFLPLLEAGPALSGAEIGRAANQPGATISVDRLRAQDLGFDAEAVSSALQTFVASRQVGE